MEIVKQRIQEQAEIVSNQVLRLDAILNQQVDPKLMMQIGEEFADRFQGENVTKVITVESSGIPVAFASAAVLGVPLLFARRKKSWMTDEESLCERVPSFTKGIVTDLVVSKRLLTPEDRLLFIDDIIANGDVARGLLRIVERSRARLIGMGVVIEKTFQSGARTIRDHGVRLESIVRISSLEGGIIEFEA